MQKNSQDKEIREHIIKFLAEKSQMILAIDGRCAAGKTTLAGKLAENFLCPVIHMDDFFLRPEQRTKERLEEPGGNIDYERFLEEVLLPLKRLWFSRKEAMTSKRAENIGEGQQETFSYRPFDCHSFSLKAPVTIQKSPLVIVEGSYSCHPKLWEYYDFHVFLDVTKEEQRKRILLRNGEDMAKVFQEKWIPMEEKYFEHFQIRQKCDMVLECNVF